MSDLARPLETFTYREYATWPESVRGDLIDGLFYAQAAPSTRHQQLSARIIAQLIGQLRGQRCRPFAAPTDVLLVPPGEADDDVRTVVQPDLLIVCDRAKIGPRYIRGAPDFVLEILSPGTARHDQIRKLRVYEQHGVPEFWTIDPDSRVLMIYTQIAPNTYGRPQIIEAIGSTALAVVENVAVDWDEAFAE